MKEKPNLLLDTMKGIDFNKEDFINALFEQ